MHFHGVRVVWKCEDCLKIVYFPTFQQNSIKLQAINILECLSVFLENKDFKTQYKRLAQIHLQPSLNNSCINLFYFFNGQ